MNNDLIADITKLTDEWYALAGRDHHKDRDCHWYLETVWSYGHPPKYRVRHDGYLLHEINEVFPSYDEALIGLRDLLAKSIAEAKTWEFD
jgi:hypothetical protein